MIFSKRQKWIKLLIGALQNETDQGKREKLNQLLEAETNSELLLQRENYYRDSKEAMNNKENDINFSKAIGRNLRYVREKNGYSQADIADVLLVRVEKIEEYERGVDRISAISIYRLADFMGISIVPFFENLPEYKLMMPDIEVLEIKRKLNGLYEKRLSRGEDKMVQE